MNFKNGASSFSVKANGKGSIEVYLDSLSNKPVAVVSVDGDSLNDIVGEITSNAFTPKENSKSNVHNVYFVLSNETIQFDSWQFAK